ncbi:MAG: GDSL-type esterase/lipase family protein [Nitrospira sp.]|nr:SGNH/GDSL hydrolase family protein [Nitrospira sp.]
MPFFDDQMRNTLRIYGMAGVYLLMGAGALVTAYDIASFLANADPVSPFAVRSGTTYLLLIEAILPIIAFLFMFAGYQIQASLVHRTVVGTWSLPFSLLLVCLIGFLWLVYYPIPRHSHHIDKFSALALVMLLWSGWYALSPTSLQQFLDGRPYHLLKVAFLNIVIFLCIGETAMRLADPLLGRSGLFGGKHTPADLRPHAEVTGSIKRSNSQGFRDKERTFEKPDTHTRVLAIGDSFTWGAGVTYDQAFVTLLERRLQAELPRVELINQGVPGWEPPQELHLLRHHGIHFQPDLVVLNFFVGNDIIRRRGAERDRPLVVAGQSYYVHENGNWVHDNLGPERWFLYHNLNYLFRVGMLTLRPDLQAKSRRHQYSPLNRPRQEYLQELDERTDIYLREYPPAVESNWNKTWATLQEMKDFLLEQKVRLLIVLIPDQIQLDGDLRKEFLEEVRSAPFRYDFEKPQTLLMEWCTENRVSCLNLLPAFNEHPEPSSLYLKNDLHWSTDGHALAAEVMFPVVKNQLLDLMPQTSLRQQLASRRFPGQKTDNLVNLSFALDRPTR